MNKKVIITGLALTGALLVSASAAKADAYMELISGSTTIAIAPGTAPNYNPTTGDFEGQTGNGAIFVGSVGTWSVDIASGGESGGFNVTLTDNINGSATQTHGLEVLFSSGSYALDGAYNFGASDSGGNSLTAAVSGFVSSSLYTGSGPLGTSLGSWTLGKTDPESFQNTNIMLKGTSYITEEMVFGGGTGPITPQEATINATASFTPVQVADGGWTAVMAGATLFGMIGVQSKVRGKRA